MISYIKLFFYKIKKTRLIEISLLMTFGCLILILLYFNSTSFSLDYKKVTFYTFYNVNIQFIIAFIIMQYFQLEDKSNNYNRLLQIPKRGSWLFSIYFSFFIVLAINIVLVFLFASIFLQDLSLFKLFFNSLFFNIIYIPIFTILAIKFSGSIVIGFSFVTMIFSIYYGTTTLGEHFRDFIPILYAFSSFSVMREHNICLLILFYLVVLNIVLYLSKIWYEKLDG